MFLKWLYNRNKQKFWDLIVADFYADIPSKISAPAIDFLTKARESLEPFWSVQAYNIQRRSISDPKNAQVYQGILISIRTLLALVSKQKPLVPEGPRSPMAPKEDPIQNVEAFMAGFKNKK